MTDTSSKLRNTGLALGAIGLGGFAADYALNVGLSRLLDPHEYGDFRVAHAFASFAGVAVLLGGDRAAPMVMSGLFKQDDRAGVWEYLRFYLRLGTLLSLAVMAVTWIGAALHVGSQDPREHHALAWVVVAVPVIAAGAMVSRTLQSAERQVWAALPWRVGFPLLKLALIGLAAAVAGGVHLHGAVMIAVVATVVVAGGQWWALRRSELPTLERDAGGAATGDWLRASVPMMGAFLVALALNQSDLYFLEIFAHDDQVGHYAAASTSAHFLLILQATVIGLVAPRLRPAIDRGAEEARAVYSHGMRMLLAVTVPVALGLAVAAKPILAIFGPSFVDAVAELELLVIGNAAWALAALATLWLQYTGRATVVLAVTIVTLIADSGLNWILIPRFGMAGAALSTAGTLSGAALTLLVLRRRAAKDGGS
ncbi:MAG: polysaccharide biosynthesis C-terminal domain-containing protein [Acidobacteriota bacterium]